MKIVLAVFVIIMLPLNAMATSGEWKTTTSLIDESKYKNNFEHYDHVNPDAPKGGTLNSATLGTYDSFNPFIVKGSPAAGLNWFGGLLWDTLMEQSVDEPSVSHPLIAAAYKHPEDFSQATYRLNENAKWHDGKPITPEDVKWSMEILKEHSPNHTRYFENVTEIKILNKTDVLFIFDQKGNRELPHIIGDLPVLPKHWWENKDFNQSTLEPPLGSGPYKIGKFEAGDMIVWELVDDYWAQNLPTRKGRYNYAKRIYRYFGDENAVWQAFTKGGLADIRTENRAARWAQDYTFPAFKKGDVVRDSFKDTSNYPMTGWVMNQRKNMFKNRKTREALATVLNFEQMNETLFFGQYNRLETYFGGGVLSATGKPMAREKEILMEYKDKIPNEIFTQEFSLPQYNSRQETRKHLKTAFDLLGEAGWIRKDDKWTKDGEILEFKILGYNPASERIHAPWINSLRKLGINAEFQIVDQSQYIQRLQNYEFDVVSAGSIQSLSPGNEQRGYWGSQAADAAGSNNLYGLKNKIVDELIERIIAAPDRDELVALTKALDRILLFEHLVVMQWYFDQTRIAWWNKFEKPPTQPSYRGWDPHSWWINTTKEAELNKRY